MEDIISNGCAQRVPLDEISTASKQVWYIPHHGVKGDPVEFCMTVHSFGATSSPRCATFALKTTADQYEKTCNSPVADFIRRNFYVDDGLKSVQSFEQAKELIKNTKSLCQRSGFRLHKFTSNCREVLSSIPQEDRAADTKDHRLVSKNTAIERALGVHW